MEGSIIPLNSVIIKRMDLCLFLFKLKKLAVVCTIYIVWVLLLMGGVAVIPAKAAGDETPLGVARVVEIKDKNTPDGSIITSTEKGAVLATVPYDPHVMGVVARDAAILIANQNQTGGLPVIANGQVYVLVSSKDGSIKKGDMLTTSTTPGVAVKAVKSGYVLGTAFEDYSNPDPKKVDKIVVDLDLHYFNSKPTFPGSLTDIFKIALLTTREAPTAIFKYLAAAAVVLGSFVLGFMTFGRTAAKGVEALGRNPAAHQIIYLGIIFNISVVVVIILAGLTVAFLILRL